MNPVQTLALILKTFNGFALLLPVIPYFSSCLCPLLSVVLHQHPLLAKDLLFPCFCSHALSLWVPPISEAASPIMHGMLPLSSSSKSDLKKHLLQDVFDTLIVALNRFNHIFLPFYLLPLLYCSPLLVSLPNCQFCKLLRTGTCLRFCYQKSAMHSDCAKQIIN